MADWGFDNIFVDIRDVGPEWKLLEPGPEWYKQVWEYECWKYEGRMCSEKCMAYVQVDADNAMWFKCALLPDISRMNRLTLEG